jgi:hypothetical protein
LPRGLPVDTPSIGSKRPHIVTALREVLPEGRSWPTNPWRRALFDEDRSNTFDRRSQDWA